MTQTFTQSLTDGLSAQVEKLAHLRKVNRREAWRIMAASCRENIEASVGYSEGEDYWRAGVAISERQAVDESDPRWGKS